MKKKVIVAVLTALALTAFLAACGDQPSAEDPSPAGKTYKTSKIEDGVDTLIIEDSSVTKIQNDVTIKIVQDGETYKYYEDDVDKTDEQNQQSLKTMFYFFHIVQEFTFTDTTYTYKEAFSTTGLTGTYEINGNTLTLSGDMEGTLTSSDNWRTFIMEDDGKIYTFKY